MPLIVFGAILLIMSLIARIYMKREVENQNCNEEVKDVKQNKILSKVLPAVSVGMIAVGIILEIIF